MLEMIPEGPRKSSRRHKQFQKSRWSHKRAWIPGDRRRPHRVDKSTCSVPRGPRKISKGRHVHLFSSKGTQKDLKDSTFSLVQFQGDPERPQGLDTSTCSVPRGPRKTSKNTHTKNTSTCWVRFVAWQSGVAYTRSMTIDTSPVTAHTVHHSSFCSRSIKCSVWWTQCFIDNLSDHQLLTLSDDTLLNSGIILDFCLQNYWKNSHPIAVLTAILLQKLRENNNKKHKRVGMLNLHLQLLFF